MVLQKGGVTMVFWRRKKETLTLDQQILQLLMGRPRDLAGISIELGVFDEARVRQAVISLVKDELVELQFDPRRTEEETDLNFVLWGVSTSIRKKTREQKKAHALRVLEAAPV